MYSNKFYLQYQNDKYSQNGEDGILEEMLKRLNITEGFVCEFGAWDGMYLSNTYALIEKGFKGVFIEGDPNKYSELLETVAKTPDSIYPINAYVDHNPESENSLDNLLKRTPCPRDFEVLSIDIDSYDYHVWKSLTNYRPKIIIIEINSAANTDDNNHIHTPGKYQGTGFRPTFNLGLEKGYTFFVHTGNAIFVRNDIYPQLNFHYDNELENFRPFYRSALVGDTSRIVLHRDDGWLQRVTPK
jgi:hypothetical protein